jgi:hypothetical protein
MADEIKIIEVGDGRVFECRLTHREGGGTVALYQIAGPQLTEEEWTALLTRAVVEAVGDGVDVKSWRLVEVDDDDS